MQFIWQLPMVTDLPLGDLGQGATDGENGPIAIVRRKLVSASGRMPVRTEATPVMLRGRRSPLSFPAQDTLEPHDAGAMGWT
jgi:hypothetical protein